MEDIEQQRIDLLHGVISGDINPEYYNRFCIKNGIGEKCLRRVTDEHIAPDPDTVTIKRSELHHEITQCLNQARCNEKRIVGNGELATRIIKILESALGNGE